jgi:hypothetical protein
LLRRVLPSGSFSSTTCVPNSITISETISRDSLTPSAPLYVAGWLYGYSIDCSRQQRLILSRSSRYRLNLQGLATGDGLSGSVAAQPCRLQNRILAQNRSLVARRDSREWPHSKSCLVTSIAIASDPLLNAVWCSQRRQARPALSLQVGRGDALRRLRTRADLDDRTTRAFKKNWQLQQVHLAGNL